MIVLLNGPFGVGETSVAEWLVRELPRSRLFDAEEVGFFLRKVLRPVDNPEAFQHLASWRALTVAAAALLHRTYGRALVGPMTIWCQDYFVEITTDLRAEGGDVRHYCLVA